MSYKLKNPKSIIFIVLVLAFIWMTYWFFIIPNKASTSNFDYQSHSQAQGSILQVNIHESYGDGTRFNVVDPPDTLNINQVEVNSSNLLETVLYSKETNPDGKSRTSVEDDDNALDYVEYREADKKKVTSMPSHNDRSIHAATKRVANDLPKERFKDAIHIPRKQTNILLTHTPSKKTLSPGRSELLHDYVDNLSNEKKSKESYVLIHNALASKVSNGQSIPLPLPTYIPENYYKFSSDRFPEDFNTRPNIGNGFIATVVHSPFVHISGVYNDKLAHCHRSAVPSTASFNISETVPPIKFHERYELDVSTGVYSAFSTNEFHSFTQRIFAHRTLVNLLVTEVDYEKKSESVGNITLKINLNKWVDNQDFTFKEKTSKYEEVSYKIGISNSPETDEAIEVHVMYDHIPPELKPPPGFLRCKWVFLTSYGFNQEEVESHYEEAKKLLVSRDDMYVEHVKGWALLWQNGRIDVTGDKLLTRSLYASFYYLLSSIPLHFKHFFGLSTSGLPFGDVNYPKGGRVKVDQELLMFPPLLLMHANLAKNILLSRNFTKEGAYVNAKTSHINGLVFPVESASSGIEMSVKRTGVNTPHVSAAVLFAIKQYLLATNDTDFVNNSLSSIVFDVADFLHSIMTFDNKVFHILNQMPLDETFRYIHDSLSGNALIKRVLSFPHDLAPNDRRFLTWKEDASRILLPMFSPLLHAPYHNAPSSDKIAEADVLMLNYPLMMNISKELLLSDLNYYDRKISLQNTSPLSISLLAINWLDVSNVDRANFLLENLILRHTRPFMACISFGNELSKIPNDLSTMGSILQTVIQGYGGFRLRGDRMDFNPHLPLNATSLHFVGVDYLNHSLNFVVSEREVSVMITKVPRMDIQLYLIAYGANITHKLELKIQVIVERTRCAIISGGAPSDI